VRGGRARPPAGQARPRRRGLRRGGRGTPPHAHVLMRMHVLRVAGLLRDRQRALRLWRRRLAQTAVLEMHTLRLFLQRM